MYLFYSSFINILFWVLSIVFNSNTWNAFYAIYLGTKCFQSLLCTFFLLLLELVRFLLIFWQMPLAEARIANMFGFQQSPQCLAPHILSPLKTKNATYWSAISRVLRLTHKLMHPKRRSVNSSISKCPTTMVTITTGFFLIGSHCGLRNKYKYLTKAKHSQMQVHVN